MQITPMCSSETFMVVLFTFKSLAGVRLSRLEPALESLQSATVEHLHRGKRHMLQKQDWSFSGASCSAFVNMAFRLFLCGFSFGHTHGIWQFPGQGLNLSCCCDPHQTCGKVNPLTSGAQLGMEPVPLRRPEQLQSDS